MCIICVDFQKQLITADEARWNMREMDLTPEHREEVEALISESERVLEDQELVKSITDAPARYTYYVDVGKQSPEQAMKYLRGVKRRIKSGDNPLGDPDEIIN